MAEDRVTKALPPGQRALGGPPPRFGLDAYMKRRAVVPKGFRLRIEGEVEVPVELALEDIFPRRTEQVSDLHCVTTWSALSLRWSGRSFRSLWEEVIVPRARPRPAVAYLRVHALDGYVAIVPLEEALAEDAFLADRLADRALGEHGEPLRLILPQLYGYKSVKHVAAIELSTVPGPYSGGRLLAHRRGRVDLEERSGAGLQRFWRWLYRLLLPAFLSRARALSRRSGPPPSE